MTPTNTVPVPHGVPEGEQTPVELHVEIAEQLRRLTGFADLLAKLTTTRQRGLGFLTPAGRVALDRQTREERQVRDWNAQNRFPAPSGNNPVPGNLSVISADANLTMTLRHLSRRLITHLSRHGVCATTALPADPALADLIARIRDTSNAVTDTRMLLEVIRDLGAAITIVQLAVDGNDKVLLDDPCPHCQHKTLVVYFRDDLIRCDRDPRTGTFGACRCPDPICECKTKPIAYRHTWYRNPFDDRRRTPADTWARLAGLIKFARKKNEPPTTEEPPS